MPLLFPQLIAEVGRRLAAELSAMTVAQATQRAEAREQDPSSNSVFSATGGTPVTPQQLADLRRDVLAIAREHGFPDGERRDGLRCDARIAVLLRDRMNITPHEAASDGLWEYLTCVLMPDLAVWRFRDAAGRTSPERLLHGRRNNFQRLWWRAYVLAGALRGEDAVNLLAFLTEDDMVATLERPGLFGNLRMMRLYYAEFRRMVEGGALTAPREAVNRDAHKRLLRLVAVRALDSLPEEALRTELLGQLEQAHASVLRARSGGGRA
jgi:hypothetical protein